MNLELASARLLLEPLRGAHADLLFAGMAQPRIYRWISAQPPANLEALRERWQAPRPCNWAIRRVSDGRYVGKFDAELAGAVATNVGYLIFVPFWGQGYATEAVRAVASHLEANGIVEQRAFVTVGNHASERVLANAGFERLRVLPSNDTIRGQRVDDVEYVRKLRATPA